MNSADQFQQERNNTTAMKRLNSLPHSCFRIIFFISLGAPNKPAKVLNIKAAGDAVPHSHT